MDDQKCDFILSPALSLSVDWFTPGGRVSGSNLIFRAGYWSRYPWLTMSLNVSALSLALTVEIVIWSAVAPSLSVIGAGNPGTVFPSVDSSDAGCETPLPSSRQPDKAIDRALSRQNLHIRRRFGVSMTVRKMDFKVRI